ncbi:MAG: hypothetical protein ACYS7Y_25590 [Planctomycetota bacterium]|jgi:hypothetical protein
MARRRLKAKTAGNRKAANSRSLPAVARGLALFLGAFSLLNVLGDLLSPGFDANHWWIDLRPVRSPAADIFLAASAFFLLAYSCIFDSARTFGRTAAINLRFSGSASSDSYL